MRALAATSGICLVSTALAMALQLAGDAVPWEFRFFFFGLAYLASPLTCILLIGGGTLPVKIVGALGLLCIPVLLYSFTPGNDQTWFWPAFVLGQVIVPIVGLVTSRNAVDESTSPVELHT
jgi:hypothetical protein